MSKNQQIAKAGESLATQFLRSKNYKILKNNYRIPGGEIDIIAQSKDTIHFIEVKNRHQNFYGQPEESLFKRQTHKILRSALTYLHKFHQGRYQNLQFDLIAINSQTRQIKYFQNILE